MDGFLNGSDGREYVPVSHKTMHWLMGQAGLGQLRCCQEGGVVKCYDTANGRCLLTWVSTATPAGEPPCPICSAAGPSAPAPAPVPTAPPKAGVPAPAPTVPAAPLPPSGTTIIDLTTGGGRPPAGTPFPPFVRPPLPPAPPSGPCPACLDPFLVASLLEASENAWFSAERARIRGRRCGASENDKAAAIAAEACLVELRKAAGEISGLIDELCRAKTEGRAARVNRSQAAALEAFAACVSERARLEETGPGSGTPWLNLLVGAGIPAAASVLVAA